MDTRSPHIAVLLFGISFRFLVSSFFLNDVVWVTLESFGMHVDNRKFNTQNEE